MIKKIILLLIIFAQTIILGQTKLSCDNFTLKFDSVTLTAPNTKIVAETSTLKTKNNYNIQYIKYEQKKYLKITVKAVLESTRNGSLYIYSNKRQYYVKQTNFYYLDKQNAYFLIEINSNYIATIRDNAITSLVFRDTDTFEIPKTDLENIKKQADCFYILISKK